MKLEKQILNLSVSSKLQDRGDQVDEPDRIIKDKNLRCNEVLRLLIN